MLQNECLEGGVSLGGGGGGEEVWMGRVRSVRVWDRVQRAQG